jgi:hypothetical protein
MNAESVTVMRTEYFRTKRDQLRCLMSRIDRGRMNLSASFADKLMGARGWAGAGLWSWTSHLESMFSTRFADSCS